MIDIANIYTTCRREMKNLSYVYAFYVISNSTINYVNFCDHVCWFSSKSPCTAKTCKQIMAWQNKIPCYSMWRATSSALYISFILVRDLLAYNHSKDLRPIHLRASPGWVGWLVEKAAAAFLTDNAWQLKLLLTKQINALVGDIFLLGTESQMNKRPLPA